MTCVRYLLLTILWLSVTIGTGDAQPHLKHVQHTVTPKSSSISSCRTLVWLKWTTVSKGGKEKSFIAEKSTINKVFTVHCI